MASSRARLGLIFLVLLAASGTGTLAKTGKFHEYFKADRINDHMRITEAGRGVQLVLDQKAAAGFESKHKYLFGKISMQLKLVPGDSAGTVTAYYAASDNYATRDEIDLEFLGNTSGNPYILQTNVYANGVGNREQRHYLWFDPSAGFHTYSFLWNNKQIVFYVDSTPIRVFQNRQDIGVPFPTKQPMGVYSSIWNADDWATQGGRVKTDWSHAPFISSYQDFDLDACPIDSGKCGPNSGKWWDAAAYTSLSPGETAKLRQVNQKYLIYDYCTDKARFPQKPVECP